MRDSEFEFIRSLVYERSRISLGPDKRELVNARLGKRLRATNLATLEDYCQFLRSPDAEQELEDLIDVMSTNHTFFFREIAHFDFLRQRAIPEAKARPDSHRRFNVWSAASSSGEEAYSIAITLLEEIPDWSWQIVGTDISHRILVKARAATYKEDAVSKLPADVVRKHFQKGFGPMEGHYRVRQNLRDRVSFHQLNLLKGEPPKGDLYEVIFCRNVMIYFDRPTQEELVARLTRHIVPGGYLFVGHAESLTNISHKLELVKPAIYRRPLNG